MESIQAAYPCGSLGCSIGCVVARIRWSAPIGFVRKSDDDPCSPIESWNASLGSRPTARCSYRGSSLAGKRRALARRPGRLALPVFHASSDSVGCGSPDRTRSVRSSGPVGFARRHSEAVFNRFILRLARAEGRCQHRHKLLCHEVMLDYTADRPGSGGCWFANSAVEFSVNRRVPGVRR